MLHYVSMAYCDNPLAARVTACACLSVDAVFTVAETELSSTPIMVGVDS